MIRVRQLFSTIALCSVLAVVAAGCHKKVPPPAPAPPPTTPSTAPVTPPPPPPPPGPSPAPAPRPLSEDEIFARKSVQQLNDERPLDDVYFDPATKTISIKIKSDGSATFITQFIGTRKGVSIDSEKVGMTFDTISGRNPTYTLTGNELYVRALITSSKPPVNPSLKDQKKQAWTQPVTWKSE